MSYLDRPWLKLYPPCINPDLEIEQVPLFSLVDDAVSQYPDRAAMIYLGTTITFRELGDYIDRTAEALISIGIKKGSVVAIYLPNCPQFAMAFYALLKIGAIPTAVSFLYTPREMKQQLSDSGAECVIMLDLIYEKQMQMLNELKIEKVILTSLVYFLPPVKRLLGRLTGKIPRFSPPPGTNPIFLEKLIEPLSGKGYQKVDVKPSDVASISYTAGTTGLPKGIKLTHSNFVSSMKQVLEYSKGYDLGGSNYMLSYLPFFHIYAQSIMLTSGLSMGKTLLVIPIPKFEEILSMIDKYGVSMFFGVPASYSLILKHLKRGKHSLRSLKICFTSADKMPPNVAAEFKQLTGAPMAEGYGLTETCGVALGQLYRDQKEGSVGIPIPLTYVAIIKPDSDDFVPVGEIGEIAVCGPQVMTEVWMNPGRTAKYFANIAGKRWLRTGDLGRMDDEGWFYFTERNKDVIKYKGFQVFPKELERIIGEHPAVKESAVIGVDTKENYQVIKAFIVLKDGMKGNVDKDQIISFCSQNLAPYKIPKEIEFIDELPRNRIGKVMREALRETANHTA